MKIVTKEMVEERIRTRWPKEFTLLEEYKTENDKVLIKHKCGFIWRGRPRNIIFAGQGCPKCNRKRSKGEQKISKWLEERKIVYEIEKIFDWQANLRYRYDFYLPKYDLIIEYMGIQHFKEIPGWLTDTLEERQNRDLLKKEDALYHGLSYLAISYENFNQIETILKNWFNDYSARK